MHIFFTLRLVLSVATQGGCVDSDVPGHAPPYLDVSLSMIKILIIFIFMSLGGISALESSDFSALNIKLGYPQVVSAECGVIVLKTDFEKSSSASEGFAIYLEPGIAATKVKLGYQIVTTSILGYGGVRVQSGFMRTYVVNNENDNHKNFFGLEIETPIFLFVPQLGAWRHIHEDNWIISAGLGFGF